MKILFVLKSNIYSGAEHVVFSIIKNLPKDWEALYLSGDGSIRQRAETEGIPFRGVEKVTVGEIKKAVADFKPDLIHANDFTASVLCAFAAGKKVPVISHLHNTPPWMAGKNAKTLAYKLACGRIARVLTVSDAVSELYVFSSSISDKLRVIGNPFSVEEIREGLSDSSETVPASEVLFVGRLTEQKDPIRFVEIIGKLKEMGLGNISARMVGGGELKSEISAEIDERNLTKNISLEGFQPHPYDYMKQAKVLCMPSKWEGFGLVALEAMALGTPVVCSGVDGLGAIVTADCGGICRDTDDYAREIYRLLTEEKVLQDKKAAAFRRAEEFDNMDSYGKNLLAIYRETLEGN